jgi:hypothetical protein
VGEEYLERVRAYRETAACEKALRKRQVWIEPLFAEAKDWHGLRRFHLRRLWRVNCKALLTAAGQNLKRLLAKRGWGRRPLPSGAALAFLEAKTEFAYLILVVYTARPTVAVYTTRQGRFRHEPTTISCLTVFLGTCFNTLSGLRERDAGGRLRFPSAVPCGCASATYSN